jgi:hypothetical protein
MGLPESSVKKNAIPIPRGARYVERCFSTARIRITNTSCAVKKTSMNRP